MAHMVVSEIGGPQYRTQNTIVLTYYGDHQKIAQILGNLHMRDVC